MTWKATLTVDDTWELRGPIGDTILVYIDCVDTLPGHDWTDWTFSGVIEDDAGTELGTFAQDQDLGTTADELHKTMLATITGTLTVGVEYPFAIRGVNGDMKQTWWRGVIIPEANPMED